MTKFLLIVGLPLLVVLASWYWREEIDKAIPWLKGWRTVILNAIPASLIASGELLGYLAGFAWDGIVSTSTAIYMTLGFNVANIALRSMTTTPVGSKDDA